MRLLVTWILTLAGLMWVPLPSPEQAVFHGLDLVLHLGLFTLLGGLMDSVLGERVPTRRVLLGGLLAALVIESGQVLVPGREFHLLDVTANGAGILLGFGLRRRDDLRPVLPLYLMTGLGLVGTAGTMRVFEQALFEAWLVASPSIGCLVQVAFVSLAGIGHVLARERDRSPYIYLLPLVPYAMIALNHPPLYLLVGSVLLLAFWIADELNVPRRVRFSVESGLLIPLFGTWCLLGFLGPSGLLLRAGSGIAGVYLTWNGLFLILERERFTGP